MNQQLLARAPSAVRSVLLRPAVRSQVVATSSLVQSANEASFVYSGWHQQSRPSPQTAMNHRSSTSASYIAETTNNDTDVIGTHIRDYRIMSPKDSCDQHVEYQGVNYDEDYDEYNLHIAPHLVHNRCEQRLNNLEEALGHKDLYSLSSDHSISAYWWSQDAEMRPEEWFNDIVPAPAEDYDDATNSVDEGEISWGM